MIVTGDLRKTRTTHYRFIDVEEADYISYEVFKGKFVQYQPHRIILAVQEGHTTFHFEVRAKSRSGYDMTFTYATEEQYVTASVNLGPQWMLDLISEDVLI